MLGAHQCLHYGSSIKNHSYCRRGENCVGGSPEERADGKAAGKQAAFKHSDVFGEGLLGRVQSLVLTAALAALQWVRR